MKLVSGIITTHNRGADIVERAIKSILVQTHTNIEVIVVDDSKPDFADRDNVKAMVESYADKNVRYIRHPECRGACAARNTGLADAKGEIIGFLDDDDEWMPKKVEVSLPLFEDSNVALVYGHFEYYYESTNTSTIEKTPFHGQDTFEKLISTNNYIGSTSFPMLRKSCVEDVGGFDTLLLSSQDYDMWLRLSQKYSVKHVDEVTCRYHAHEGERITRNVEKRVKGTERIIEKNYEYIKKHPEIHYKLLKKLILRYIDNKQLSKAFKKTCRCCTIKPGKVKSNVELFLKIIKAVFRKRKRG